MGNTDVILENLAHHAEFLFELQGGHRKTAEIEVQWTEFMMSSKMTTKQR